MGKRPAAPQAPPVFRPAPRAVQAPKAAPVRFTNHGPSRQTIQPYIWLKDEFNAWWANNYTHAWATFLKGVDRQGSFRRVENSDRTHLRVSTEAPRGRYGNTSMWVRRYGTWYDLDKDDEYTWSRASGDSQIEIWIRIAQNLSEHEIAETLAHEWNIHGRQFVQFVDDFRDARTSHDVRAAWRQANRPGGYLNVQRQHGDLGQRQNSHMREAIRRMTSYLDRRGLFTRADDLYDEYRQDVHDH